VSGPGCAGVERSGLDLRHGIGRGGAVFGTGAESVTTVSQLIPNSPPVPLRTAVDSQRQDRPNEDPAAARRAGAARSTRPLYTTATQLGSNSDRRQRTTADLRGRLFAGKAIGLPPVASTGGCRQTVSQPAAKSPPRPSTRHAAHAKVRVVNAGSSCPSQAEISAIGTPTLADARRAHHGHDRAVAIDGALQ
jgi:hypothetical protein